MSSRSAERSSSPTRSGSPTRVKTKGVVRSVLSGDTFSIFIQDGNTIMAQLSGIHAPRLGNATRADEAFAWEAREFLRKKIIGQTLSITILNKVGDKSYVNAFFNDEDLVETMVANGWCTLHANFKGQRAEELKELEDRAREDHIGIFQTDRSKAFREVTKYKPIQLLEQYSSGKKPCAAVVDSIRSGSTLRVVLLPSFMQILVDVAGIQAPSVKWVPEQKKHEEVEPFGLNSLKFVEDHVLHRDIAIEFTSVGKNDNLFGIVKLLGRDLGAELVKMGLAKVVPGAGVREGSDYHKTLTGFQTAAVARKAGMWKVVAAPAAAAARTAASESDDKFDATVVDIPTSGIIVVERSNGSNVRIMLASVRAPHVTRDDRSGKLGKDALYKNQVAAQGRELLRTKIFDKTVTCEKRYDREEAAYYDVYLDGKNIAMALLNAGLVDVIPHRSTDPRSHDYDDMCVAEKRAQEKKIGIYAKLENVQLRRISDMTVNGSRANSMEMIPHLKNRINGVVDYVFSATRMKVFVPSQNTYMAFICSGVQAPRNTDKDPKMAAIADEGLRVMRKFAHMRDVTISNVESADNGGSFIASIECKGTNLSCMLVERGLAWVIESRRNVLAPRLAELEKKAKEEKRGFWEFYVPPAEEEAAAAEKVKEFFEATVTDLGDYGYFYLQKKEDAGFLESMTEELAEIAETSNQRDAYLHTTPKNKQMILAKFSGDGCWYRASYLGGVSGDSSKFKVLFVDFGTQEECPRADTMPLPSEYSSRPALARRARLAFIEPPKEGSSYADDFLDYFQQLVADDKTLSVNVEYVEDGALCVSLAVDSTHVNAAMLREGLATLNKKRVGSAPASGEKDAFANLREAQEKARVGRLNMWKYGDIGDDDDDDDSRRRPSRR